MKYFSLIGILIFGLLSFVAGSLWQKHTLLESGAVALSETLTLQGNSSELGALPKGTVLYPYSSGPSIDTFAVFVNTKNQNILEPISFEHYMTVSPIDGYQE